MSRWLVPLSFLAALLAMPTALAAQEASPDAKPAAGVGVEILASVVIPAAYVPAGEATLGFVHLVLDPGTTFTAPDVRPVQALQVDVVLAGQFAVQAASGLRVVRRDGTTEDVPPDAEAVLGPGDALVVLDGGQPQTLRTVGDAPVERLSTAIATTAQPATPPPQGPPPAGFSGEPLGFLAPPDWAQAGLPPGPLRVEFRRVTLAPGAALPPAAEPWPVLRGVTAGTLTREVGGLAVRIGAGENVPWMPGSEDAITLRNEGDEPAVYWELAIEPAGSEAATPGASPTG